MDEVFGGDKGEIQAEASIAKPTRPTVVKAGNIFYGRQITPQDVEHTESAHVEQKNWSVVRYTVGYDRWETEQELALLESIYDDLRFYINFFQPVLQLIAKEHIDNKTIKRYHTAKTPYQRVIERKDISFEAKAYLTNLYVQLNPAELRRRIDQKTAKFWKISR